MRSTLDRPNAFGAIASVLCMLHCLATPLFFIAQTSSKEMHSIASMSWQGLDYLFLSVSFIAVYRSTQITSKKIMRIALWGSWLLLCMIILNEKLALVHFPEYLTYVPAITLAILHIFNLNYCQCKTDNCCVKDE